MKRVRIFLFLIFIQSLSSTNLMAQNDWFWQNTLLEVHTLKDVHVFDENTALAVGEAETIIKTTDVGASWVSQTNGTSDRLNSIYFVDSNTGWIVGTGSTILKTTNGGTSWTLSIQL